MKRLFSYAVIALNSLLSVMWQYLYFLQLSPSHWWICVGGSYDNV